MELVLHSLLDGSESRVGVRVIEDLHPTDVNSEQIELEANLINFTNQDSVNLLIPNILKHNCKGTATTAVADQINDSVRFVVKKQNRYGFLQKRFCWLSSEDFTVNLSSLQMKNKKPYDLGSIAHFIKKGKGQRKVVLEFDPESRKKPIDIVFKTAAELGEFMNLAELIINNNKAASQLKLRRTMVFTQEILKVIPNRLSRTYSWLVAQPFTADLAYNCVQVYKFSKENRVLVFSADRTSVQLMSSDHKVLITFQIETLVILHVSSDARKLKLGGEGNIKVIFNSVYVKSHFCAVAYSMKHPELQLKSKAKRLKFSEVGVFIGTWNLGHQDRDTFDSLIKLLCNLQGHKVIALGFQECKKMKRKAWIKTINKMLEQAGFALLAFESMWEMFILVFVAHQLLPKVSRVVKMGKATGIANMLGNKGGVLVSFSIEDTSYCFLSCHLAASPHKISARNQNMSDLLRLKPRHSDIDLAQEFDYTFVFGDLNYRTDEDFFQAVDMLRHNNISSLLLTDQLVKQQQDNAVLTHFSEGEIHFKPTYRVIRDTHEWSNKKNQTPSWTDRILYKAFRPIEVCKYDSIVDALGSDHRPVFGSYVTQAVSWYLPENLSPVHDVFSVAMIEFKTLKVKLDLPPCVSKIAQITFSAPFIEQARGSIQVNLQCDSYEFSIIGDQMPMLQCVWNDARFLKEQRLAIMLWHIQDSSISEVIGVASLPLGPLLDFIEVHYPSRPANFTCENAIAYSAVLESQGVDVGSVEGFWTYNEVQKEAYHSS